MKGADLIYLLLDAVAPFPRTTKRLQELTIVDDDLGRITKGFLARYGDQLPKPLPNPLNQRQRQILLMMFEGCTYKQIALELNISVSTVRTHIHNLHKKLDATNVTQLCIQAWKNGWLDA
jgi:DNA-binding NarL/FixJ family response regulator